MSISVHIIYLVCIVYSFEYLFYILALFLRTDYMFMAGNR